MYASGADLQSINPLVTVHPLAKAVQKHVLLMTLAVYDSLLQPVPRLATWRWDADRTRVTFDLRRDVRWQDGVPTTATDVVRTLELARTSETGYPRAGDLGAMISISALDSFRVEIRFATRQAVFPDVLTDLAVLPAHRFEDVQPAGVRRAEFNRDPVGNGPFRFVRYLPNQRWVFERNPEFPADLPRSPIDRFVVVVVDEATTKLAGLASGELDFAGINHAHAAFVRQNPRLRVVEFPILFATGVFWNMRRAPFDERAVRRALTMAIDRQAIIDGYLYGFGNPAIGPVSAEHPWYGDIPDVPFDPQGAGELLDSVGWRTGVDGIRERDGRRFAFELMTVTSGDLGLEQMLQAQLRDIGVEISLRPLELSTFLATAQGPDREYDAVISGIPGDLSLGYVAALFGSDGGPLAYSGYASADFDDAVANARTASRERDIIAGWARAQQVLGKDTPATWIYHARGVQGVAARFRETTPDLRGELGNLHEWRLEGARE